MPISSHQISGMIAAQQQQGMMTAQQASMIGLPGQPMAAPMASGVSAYPPQMGPAQPMVMPSVPHMAPMTAAGMAPMGAWGPQSGFSYGVPQGPGIGTHIGATMAGMVGAAPKALGVLSGGAGIASMMGVGGATVAGLGMLEPVGAAMAAGSGAYGMATGAGLGGAAALGLGGLAATGVGAGVGLGIGGLYMAGRKFSGGFQQHQQLSATLSDMTFANAQSPTGRGFSPQQTRTIGAAMRSFEAADPFTTMGDMTATMQEFTDLGMAQGVRDAEEFADKFTKMADTVRKMSMAMGSSMEEASQVFGQMRQSGFYTAADVMGNTTQMNLLRGLGMSPEQFGDLQRRGASGARQNDMSGASGAAAVTGLSSLLMMGGGGANEQMLMDITGGGNLAEASGIMGQQGYEAASNFFLRSGAGQAMLLGLGETDEQGAFTTGINKRQLQRLKGGDISLQDLSKFGQQNLQGRGRQSFMARQKDIVQTLMKEDPETAMQAILTSIQEQAKGDEDQEIILAERLLDMDRRRYLAWKEALDKRGTRKQDANRRLQEELEAQRMQSEISRNRSFSGLWQKTTGTISDWFSPGEQAGADFSAGIEMGAMKVKDDLFGIRRAPVTGASVQAAAAAGASGLLGEMGGPEVSAEDFENRYRSAPGLAGAIARGGGVGGALGAVQMGAVGGLSREDMGTVLGIAGNRKENLQQVAKSLGDDSELRRLIYRAQEATKNGDKKTARRLRKKIDAKIRRKAAFVPSEKKGAARRDESVADAAFILSELGATDLVNVQLGEEQGIGQSDIFQSMEEKTVLLEAQAEEEFGAVLSGERLGGLQLEQFKGALTSGRPVMGMAMPLLRAGLEEVGILEGQGLRVSAVQDITEGGAVTDVMAALEGKEEAIKKAMTAVRGDDAAMAEHLSNITGQKVGSETAKAVMVHLKSGRDISAMAKHAKLAQENVAAGPGAETAARAFGAETMKGFTEERQSLVGQLKGKAGLRAFYEGGAGAQLLSAVTERGDLAELAKSGPMGEALAAAAGGIRAVGDKRMGSRDLLATMTAQGVSVTEQDLNAMLSARGLEADAELTGEQAKSISEEIGRRFVGGASVAGATGITFTGGVDPAVANMTLSQQLQRTVELVDVVDYKVTGREPASGGKVMENDPSKGVFVK